MTSDDLRNGPEEWPLRLKTPLHVYTRVGWKGYALVGPLRSVSMYMHNELYPLKRAGEGTVHVYT